MCYVILCVLCYTMLCNIMLCKLHVDTDEIKES